MKFYVLLALNSYNSSYLSPGSQICCFVALSVVLCEHGTIPDSTWISARTSERLLTHLLSASPQNSFEQPCFPRNRIMTWRLNSVCLYVCKLTFIGAKRRFHLGELVTLTQRPRILILLKISCCGMKIRGRRLCFKLCTCQTVYYRQKVYSWEILSAVNGYNT